MPKLRFECSGVLVVANLSSLPPGSRGCPCTLPRAVAGSISDPMAEPAARALISLQAALLNTNIIWQEPGSLSYQLVLQIYFFSIGFVLRTRVIAVSELRRKLLQQKWWSC